MLASDGPRFRTPKNALIAFLVLALVVPFYFLLWVDRAATQCPVFNTPPSTKGKP
jgi:hypothetical protein